MKLDIANALYTAGMIILAFAAAIVMTKIISKYLDKRELENKKDKKDEDEV